MSQLKPMRGFNLGPVDRRQQSVVFRKIFDEKEVATGNILFNRRLWTNKIVCPQCKPKQYIYGDTKRERLQKLEEHLKDKHS
jgi:hypothetical protein